jgi:hypothetical protein
MPPSFKTEKPSGARSRDRSGSSHETLWRADEALGPSNRSFGLTLAGVLAALGAISLWRGGLQRGTWELGLAVALLAVAGFVPGVLAPLNRAWTWIGRRLNRVVSPLLIIVLFYGVVTPAGLAMRALGKDPLRRRFDRQSSSYWIDCREGSKTSDMRRQF